MNLMAQGKTRASSEEWRHVLPTNLGLFYGGEWHSPAAGRTLPVLNPANGDVLAHVALADREHVDRAVAAANSAFPAWAALSPLKRSEYVRGIAKRVREAGDELAMLDALDSGNPLKGMLLDIQMGSTIMEYFAGLSTEIKGSTIPMPGGVLNYVLREPLGVVARLVAFNHPLLFAIAKIAAPLIAGNTVVLKPSEHTPLSALRLAELVQDLLPPGVLNILNGDRAAGEALATHPGVASIAVVGSIATGRAVMRAGAETLKRVTLELGGKNALIGYPDADPAKVAAGCVKGMNFDWTAGQSCGSTSRVLVHESIYSEVIEAVSDLVGKIRLGQPTAIETEMGCLSSQAQFEKVTGYIEGAKRDGVQLVAGGGRGRGDLERGYFVEPTVFADVAPDHRIAREEIFGPVLSILKWSDEAALFEAVNSVPYGLTASVWTNDLSTAHRAAARIQAGYIWINGSSSHFLGAPFGGYKQSGLGREESIEELHEFTQLKNVNVTLSP
ncbi:aldehyde dehydrogenase family protein [Aquibium sp. LZ166]|uniref:Aldehyde dehydrogenase family protein n=1 Tax=Aquibium pacificus TaxID=3153579 RepID=A0ABV3SEU5_9HYPH